MPTQDLKVPLSMATRGEKKYSLNDSQKLFRILFNIHVFVYFSTNFFLLCECKCVRTEIMKKIVWRSSYTRLPEP